jgi:DNA-binding Lrp family transcriptional regulator
VRNDANRPAYDAIDRGLVHALQLDGRVPFARIAEVLGVSDQTIARRYARLRGSGTLRVVGLPEAAALGESWWTVRLTCVPGSADEIAGALARRDDTLWVGLVSGGAEISFGVRSGSGESGHPLLERLPRTRRVVGMTAHLHLHRFFGGPLSLVNKLKALDPEQVERLCWRPDRADEAGQGGRAGQAGPITETDRRLITALTHDGRAPLAELAAATGWSQTSVRRRMAELRAGGVLFFDTEYSWRAFGLAAQVVLWLSVAPSRLAETGEALADHPEVAFCTATTGPSNLMAVAVCADASSLYTYLTTRIAALPAVERVESAPVMRIAKALAPPDGPRR